LGDSVRKKKRLKTKINFHVKDKSVRYMRGKLERFYFENEMFFYVTSG